MSIFSPRRGTCPRRLMTRPPTVSISSCASWLLRRSLKSASVTSALTTYSPPSRGMIMTSSSISYSSAISPTICSSTSSMVTSPATPPYSSTTIAMWLRLVRNSRSSTFRGLVFAPARASRPPHRRWPPACLRFYRSLNIGVGVTQFLEQADFHFFHHRGVPPLPVIVAAQVQYTVNHHVRPMGFHGFTLCVRLAPHHRRADNQIAEDVAARAGRRLERK